MTFVGFREPRETSPKHLVFVRKLPCVDCMREPCGEAAHVRMGDLERGERWFGKAERPHDRRAVPLCRRCHLDKPDAQHRMNEEVYWERLGINPLDLARAIWQHRDEGLEVCRKIVIAFRLGRKIA
jgi:hypothetical protein